MHRKTAVAQSLSHATLIKTGLWNWWFPIIFAKLCFYVKVQKPNVCKYFLGKFLYVLSIVKSNNNKNLFTTAICKLRHWNLGIGIGIGIGTDITNVIVSSSIRPMDPKLGRVVT